ncbi:MAG: glycosyl transferase family 2, partial [Candidatus Kapaibacterium sp.]
LLAESGVRAITNAIADPSFTVGTLRLRLAGHHPLYGIYSWFTRFDSIWTSFGDQGIVIRRGFYDRIGGFPEWPLLEDVQLLREARRVARIHSLPGEIITSARRFERVGIARQQLRNGGIILRYLLGASPESLARVYADEPASEGGTSPEPTPAVQ